MSLAVIRGQNLDRDSVSMADGFPISNIALVKDFPNSPNQSV